MRSLMLYQVSWGRWEEGDGLHQFCVLASKSREAMNKVRSWWNVIHPDEDGPPVYLEVRLANSCVYSEIGPGHEAVFMTKVWLVTTGRMKRSYAARSEQELGSLVLQHRPGVERRFTSRMYNSQVII